MTRGPSPPSSPVLLFVYGSLKSGYENAHLLARATCLGAARTALGHRLIRYQEGYPALVPVASSPDSVTGELYLVDAALLAELDVFEDCPALYQRVTIDLDDGRAAQAYLAPPGSESAWPELDRY